MEETIEHDEEIEEEDVDNIGSNKPIVEQKPERHPGGRPLTYSEEILTRAREYLDMCEDEEEQQLSGLSVKGTELYKSKVKVNLPSKGGLAYYICVSRDTLYEWAKSYPEFSDIMEELSAKQEKHLINKGLSGDYNPTIAKVLLTKHGYIDKSDVTSDGKAIKGNGIVFSNFKDETNE